MPDVKTAPVRSTFVEYADFFDDEMMAKVPGSICEDPDTPGRWLYACPCGCGASGGLRVAAGTKPPTSPSWLWNGSKDEPVLSPSVHHVGHWHGWLGGSSGERPGFWISC